MFSLQRLVECNQTFELKRQAPHSSNYKLECGTILCDDYSFYLKNFASSRVSPPKGSQSSIIWFTFGIQLIKTFSMLITRIFIIVLSLVSGANAYIFDVIFYLQLGSKIWIVYSAFGSGEVAQNNKSLMALLPYEGQIRVLGSSRSTATRTWNNWSVEDSCDNSNPVCK